MRRSREEWVQIVEQFERSSQSHETFCMQHRLNVGSFRGWLYRLRSVPERGKVARSATRLLPVRVAAPGAADDETVLELAVGDAMLRAGVRRVSAALRTIPMSQSPASVAALAPDASGAVTRARVPDAPTLRALVDAWLRSRKSGKVRWRFRAEDARIKLHRLYPSLP